MDEPLIDESIVAPLTIGLVGLVVSAGLAYAFWPADETWPGATAPGTPAPGSAPSAPPGPGKPQVTKPPVVETIFNMTPEQRLAQHAVGDEVVVDTRTFLVTEDGGLTPGPAYTTTVYAGQPLIVEQDGAVNLLGAPPQIATYEGRVEAGLAGARVAIMSNTIGHLAASTPGYASPGSAPGAVHVLGTDVEIDASRTRGDAAAKGWWRLHVQGSSPDVDYFWAPAVAVAWDPIGTRAIVEDDGTLGKVDKT